MAHVKTTRDDLRKRYVFARLSLKQAARQTGIAYGTAARWKAAAKATGDDWDKVRTAHTMASGDLENLSRQLLTDFLVASQHTMALVKNGSDMDAMQRVGLLTSLSDSYNKVILASRRMLPETSELATALKVIDMLSEHLKTAAPEHLATLVDVLPAFAEKLEKSLI